MFNIQYLKKYTLSFLRTKTWFRTITITLLAFVLSHSILYQITSSSLFSLQKDNDFEMSDFYNVVANNRPIRTYNSDIVIVSLDNCSRTQIAQLIERVAYMQPKAIGIDVFFSYHSEDDSILINAINSFPNIVLAYDAYHETQTAFASDLYSATWGSINLIAKHASGTIREFRPQFNDSIYAFSAQLAYMADSTAFNRLIERGRELETIHFPSQTFEEVNGLNILEGDVNLFELEELLYNKVVLMGDVHNPFDQHKTPINSNMAGIVINAHILSTILSNTYIESTPTWFNWTLAIAISLLLSYLIVFFQTSNVLKSYTTFMIRVFQVIIIAIFLYVGCYIFAHHHYYCNFALALFMVGLGVLAVAVEPVVYLLLQGMEKVLHWLYIGTKFLAKQLWKNYKKMIYTSRHLLKRLKKESSKHHQKP